MSDNPKSRKKITNRCPNGSRKNKKGDCEPIDEITSHLGIPSVVANANAAPAVDATAEQLDYVAKQLAYPIQTKPALAIEDADTESASATEPVETPVAESCDYDLEKDLNGIDCNSVNLYSGEACNNFMLKKEQVERNCIKDQPDANQSLYPNVNDANFNIKIASKQEFNDTKYDGEIYENI